MNYPTSAPQRKWENGKWNPLSPVVAQITPIDPTEKGLHIVEFGTNPGDIISRPFTVNNTATGYGFFKLVNEIDGQTKEVRSASITTSPNGQGKLIHAYSGAQTNTDQQHARYRAAGHGQPANAEYLDLDTGATYYYNVWNSDGSGGPIAIGHQNN